MLVAFRVDASRRIGTGHVMRCLALAHGLRERGAQVTFICADLPGNLIEYLQGADFSVHRLPRTGADCEDAPVSEQSLYEEWLGVPWRVDAEQTCNVLQGDDEQRLDFLIVDHYALDHRWERIVRRCAEKILVIDDLADRRHDCDVLLDQNLPGDDGARYRDLVREDTVTLTGPNYALLRSEFVKTRSDSSVRDAGLRRLLIMFGGFDETGETLKALRGVAKSALDITLDVIVSSRNHRVREIGQIASGLEQVSMVVQPPNLASIMARADFSLGAGGITLWERCAVRLPSASTIVADNQRTQILMAKKAGLTLLTSSAGDTNEASYRDVVNAIWQKPEFLKRMSSVCGRAVDGQGVQRVTTLIDKVVTEATQ